MDLYGDLKYKATLGPRDLSSEGRRGAYLGDMAASPRVATWGPTGGPSPQAPFYDVCELHTA